MKYTVAILSSIIEKQCGKYHSILSKFSAITVTHPHLVGNNSCVIRLITSPRIARTVIDTIARKYVLKLMYVIP